MKKNDVSYVDPWQELAGNKRVKKVSLDEALGKLKVSEEDAPAVKKGMLNQVRKLTKGDTAPGKK
jgi:hypothetical protein